jgi:hypothetical protein
VQALLDTAIGIDPVVYSQFYRVLSIFHKVSCFVLCMDDSHEFWCVAGPHVGLIARLLSFFSLSFSLSLVSKYTPLAESIARRRVLQSWFAVPSIHAARHVVAGGEARTGTRSGHCWFGGR